MPYFHMDEVWTPLRIVKVRLFRDKGTGEWYIKVGDRHRRKLGGADKK
jgi:hypothetical protein